MSSSTSITLDDNERHEISVSYGTIIATGLLAIMVCCARLYVRKFLVRAFGLDDWACLVGLVFVTIFNAIGLAVVYYGAGKHIQNVSTKHLEMWFLLYYICICMYLTISLAVKSSILFFLRRVFPVPYIQRATLWMLIFLALFTVTGTFVAAFQCTPPQYAFQLELLMSVERADHCFSSDAAYGIFMYQAVVIFICDIITLLLPIPALCRLNLSRAKRTALLLVFASGTIACLAPAVRFRSLNFYKTGSTDTTYEGAASLYWMAIEYNIGLVAGSLTALRPLLSKMGVRNLSHSSSGAGSHGNKNFAPAYQLEECDGKFWARRQRFHQDRYKYQGDSVLDQTVVEQRSSIESNRGILKEQVFTLSEESRDYIAHTRAVAPRRNGSVR